MRRLLFFFMLSALSRAETLALFVDNDGFAGTDLEYSSGVRLAYLREVEEAGRWSGFSLSHQIFTPESFFLSTPPVDERPFSAWLAVGYGHGIIGEGHTRAIEWSLGVVGEWALGEPLQDIAHTFLSLNARGFVVGMAKFLQSQCLMCFMMNNGESLQGAWGQV